MIRTRINKAIVIFDIEAPDRDVVMAWEIPTAVTVTLNHEHEYYSSSWDPLSINEPPVNTRTRIEVEGYNAHGFWVPRPTWASTTTPPPQLPHTPLALP